LPAVKPEWLSVLGQKNLLVVGAFSDERVRTDEAFVSDNNIVRDRRVHGEKTVSSHGHYPGEIRAGSKPAMVADGAVMSDHSPAPDEDIISEPNVRVDHDMVHDEAVLAILAVLRQARVGMDVGNKSVSLPFGFLAFASSQRIEFLIADSDEHRVPIRWIELLDFLERNSRKTLPGVRDQKGAIHRAGHDFEIAVVAEKIKEHLGDLARAKKDDRFHEVAEAIV
jgi:hypothetical protein